MVLKGDKVMDINEFVIAFAEQFEDVDTSEFTAETKFQELQESPVWDSLTVLTVLAMIKTNYGVTLSALDINNCRTIADVYALVEKAHG